MYVQYCTYVHTYVHTCMKIMYVSVDTHMLSHFALEFMWFGLVWDKHIGKLKMMHLTLKVY